MHIWIASRSVPSLHPRAGAECKLIIFCVGPFLPMATASVSYEKSFTFLYFILYSVFFLAPSGHKQGTGRAFDRSIDVHKTSERDQNISLSTYDERAAAILQYQQGDVRFAGSLDRERTPTHLLHPTVAQTKRKNFTRKLPRSPLSGHGTGAHWH